MRKLILPSLAVLIALNAFAHAGEVHTYMGTVTALDNDGSFTLNKTDGNPVHVEVATTTIYRHADGRPATRTDLEVGRRVVVTIAKDGKTAMVVKVGVAKSP